MHATNFTAAVEVLDKVGRHQLSHDVDEAIPVALFDFEVCRSWLCHPTSSAIHLWPRCPHHLRSVACGSALVSTSAGFSTPGTHRKLQKLAGLHVPPEIAALFDTIIIHVV